MSYPTPRDRRFRAKGDGIADDYEALQKFFDGIAGSSGLIDRWYLTSKQLQVHAGTTLYGTHRSMCGFMPHKSMPIGEMLFTNKAWTQGTDRLGGIRVFNVGFTGNPQMRDAPHPAAMVVLIGTTGTMFVGCGFSWWRHLVTPANARWLRFVGCEFSEWATTIDFPLYDSPAGKAIRAKNIGADGKPVVPEDQLPLMHFGQFDGGYALLGGAGGYGSWAQNDEVDIIDCYYHDGLWTAVECLQEGRWRLINTTIERVKECGIYCGAEAIIDRSTILDITGRDISQQPIEGGGFGMQLTRSTFGRSDGPWLFLSTPNNAYIGHNTFFDAMVAHDPADTVGGPFWGAGFFIRTLGHPTIKCRDVLFEENTIINTTGKASHPLSVYDNGGGKISDFTWRRNRTLGPWRSSPLMDDGNVIGSNFNFDQEVRP